ncbi:MAG: DNA adenine methylase [Alphaproteobacteria bacterium]|nr:MAG: DNA adenine methylase [Alphaproteobacteria bacterium]
MSTTYTAVRSLRPPAPYQGGKRQLAERLVTRINAIEHTGYIEPFLGMGGIFLRRDHRPPTEAINDANAELITLFRLLQRHYNALMDELRWRLSSRAEFERLAATDPTTLTDLERACRFVYLQRLSFGGKAARQSFGTTPTGTARFNIHRLEPLLEAIHERLASVVIECLPWQQFLTRWGRATTLAMLDPPYIGTEDAYAAAFAPEEHEELAAALQHYPGPWLLTINDCARARRLFGRWHLEEVSLTYSIAGAHQRAKSARELIISNHPPPV